MSPRYQFVIIGAVLGGILGALSAWTYVRAKENGGLFTTRRENGREVAVKAGVPDYFRLGLTVIGLVRQMQNMVTEPSRVNV